jgi:hypothetical protein
MGETVVFFVPTRLTNHRKAKKINKKTAKLRFYLFWQGHLCDSRVDFIRDLLLLRFYDKMEQEQEV